MSSRPEIPNYVPTPDVLSTRERTRRDLPLLENKEIAIGDIELKKFQRADRLFSMLLEEGYEDVVKENYTFAMVKPQANEGHDPLHTMSDDEAENFLIEQAEERGFTVVFRLPYQFSEEDVEDFYHKVKPTLVEKPTRVKGEETNVWDTMKKFLTQNPTTMLLLRKEENESGEAWQLWRETMGKTNPSEADPDSLRGMFAVTEHLPNNLYHGSGSAEEAYGEIQFFAQKVRELCEDLQEGQQAFPSEKELQDAGIIDTDHYIHLIKPIYTNKKLGTISRYKIKYEDEAGRILEKTIKLNADEHLEKKMERIAKSTFLTILNPLFTKNTSSLNYEQLLSIIKI